MKRRTIFQYQDLLAVMFASRGTRIHPGHVITTQVHNLLQDTALIAALAMHLCPLHVPVELYNECFHSMTTSRDLG